VNSNLRVSVSFPACPLATKNEGRAGILWRRVATQGQQYSDIFAPPVLALIVCLAPPALRAQAIDQYLDTTIPGYNTAPGVTVASREHPEYDPSGVRVGGFTLLPTLDESVGYDDNVTGTGDPHGSVLLDTSARLDAMNQMSDGSLGASVSVDNAEYPNQSSQSYTNWTAALGGTHDFGGDTLTIGATHLNLSQTPRDLDAPELNSPIAYRVDDMRAAYRVVLSRLSLEPAFDVSWYGFDNGTVLGKTYLQTYRDRIAYSPGVTANYEFATRRSIVFVVRDTSADFANAVPGVPSQNYNDVSTLTGVAYDVDGALSFRLLGGYEQRNFRSGAYKTISAPILEGSVTWTPTGLTTITGTAARYIEDSSAEATIGYTESALRLNVDHELYRNIVLNANAGLFVDNYAQNGGSQEYFTGGTGVTWRLNRNMRLVGDYTYSSRRSSGTTTYQPPFTLDGVFGGNYSENVFRIRLRFAL